MSETVTSCDLLPNQITTSTRYSVRPFSANATINEDHLIEELALSLEVNGQLDPLLIDVNRVLIAGHRRRAAAIVINERRSARGLPLFRLRCTVVAGDLRRKAIVSNVHRREVSPMDMAYLLTEIRAEKSWTGWQGTKQLAVYLGLNEATVNGFEHLLKANRQLQECIHNGTVSAASANDLMRNLDSPQARMDAIERAGEIQSENQLDHDLHAYKLGKKTLAQTTAAIHKPPPVRIEHPAIVAAIRERHIVTPSTKRLPLNRSELIHAVEALDCEGCSETGRNFVRYLVKQFAVGTGDIDGLRARFLAIGHHDIEPPPVESWPIPRVLSESAS